MKKVVSLIMLLATSMTAYAPGEIEALAGAFASMSKGVGKEAGAPGAAAPGAPAVVTHSTDEQLNKRLDEIREKVKNNLVATPTEARDTAIEYLILLLQKNFQPLADTIAGAIRKTNPKLGDMVARTPKTVGDIARILLTLFKEVYTKEYQAAVKALINPVNCLFAKQNSRATLKDTEGNLICKDPSFKAIIIEILGKGTTVIKPFVNALVIGGEIGGQKVDGLIQIGLTTLNINLGAGGSLAEDLALLKPLFAIVLDLPTDLKVALGSKESVKV